jgi:hypothetical protein
MKRLLGRRCAAGHLIEGANGSWQLSGRGDPFLTCRRCNALRAKLWRAANADRLGYRVGATSGGKVLPYRAVPLGTPRGTIR